MDGRGDHGDSVAIIGIACRFPGARDPAEFHDLAVAGRGMFQPAAALPGRPARVSSLHAVVVAAGALQTGELDLAVAGGAELGLAPAGRTGRGRRPAAP